MGYDGKGRRDKIDNEHTHIMVTNGLERHRAQPVTSFNWTSHTLRKGAASTSNTESNAIKIPLSDIRYAGGWSTNSTILEAKYNDFAMPPSKAAHIFFGHLKRDTPADP
jgi:hypothetical protein